MLFLVVEPDHEVAWTLRHLALEYSLYFVSDADEARFVVQQGYVFDGIICEDEDLDAELRELMSFAFPRAA